MILYRQPQNGTQTIGSLCFEGYELATMELPWRDNQTSISCIPVGTYKAIPRYSNKFGNHFIVQSVPGRSYILFHKMNYFFQGRGCIGLGMYHKDINKDGNLDTARSGDAIVLLRSKFPEGFEFEIIQR